MILPSHTQSHETTSSTKGRTPGNEPTMLLEEGNLEQYLLGGWDATRQILFYTTTEANVLHHLAMTQYSLEKGLKVFVNSGSDAVYKEMKQLHDQKVCEP